MAVHVTDEEWSAYQQRCRENRDAWWQDLAGRSLVGSPYLVAEEGAGGTTTAARVLRAAQRGQKPPVADPEPAGQGSRSADRLAGLVRAQEGNTWVQEPRGRRRRARSADKLIDRMMGQPGGEESGESDSDSAA
jgi:hypothetical protein